MSEKKTSDDSTRSANELQGSNTIWTNIFQAIAHPTLILNPGHEILAANAATLKAVGKPAEEIVGKKCHDIFHSKNGSKSAPPPECCPMKRLTNDSEIETEQMEVEALGRIYLVACTPVIGPNGNLEQIIHIATDITATKKAELEKAELEQKLLRAQKMESIGRITGTIAHDFNNLLLPILAYSELLTEDISKRDPRQHSLVQIKEAAERAKHLTSQLLAFSRHQVLDLKTLNLNRIVTNFEAIFRQSVKENIEFKIQLTPKRLTFLGDVSQIERMVMNLVVNAQDAMPYGGKLTIKTDSVELTEVSAGNYPDLEIGTYVVLSVIDTGVGIEEQILKNIFEPFFTTKKSGKGTGLGLSTTFGIARQHNGGVTVESEKGKGSTFQVFFPAREGRTSSVDGLAEKKNLVGGDETLLVVEDDDTVRDTITDLLKYLGYKILQARGGIQGLEIAENHAEPIDLLLTDLVMPDLGGKELYQKIHFLKPEIKVLFMSGFTDETISKHGLSLDHSDFLAKPFTIAVLAKKIRKTLDGE